MLDVPGIKYFTNKNIWSGSHGNVRCRIAPNGEEIVAFVWPEPWCFDKTEKEQIVQQAFECNAVGLANAIKWIEEQM